MARLVTIKQVAEAVGVHPSTVSRALDPAKRSLVGDEVVQRVMRAAEHLGYHPDAAAAALRSGKSRLVGIIVPDIANPVFSPIISGLEDRLSMAGYGLIVAEARQDDESILPLIDSLAARRVDGLVLATVSLEGIGVTRCLERRLPVVLVNRSEARLRASSIVSDDHMGMQLAVDHLQALGHRHIGHIAGPLTVSTGLNRRAGFEAAMQRAGLSLTTAMIEIASAYSREAGEQAVHRLLSRSPAPTALVAANDLLALGAYMALKSHGLHCPRDVSVIGHNDMPLVDLVDPPLTTIRINPREMGQTIADELIAIMGGSSEPVRTLITVPTLVERGSTARLRA